MSVLKFGLPDELTQGYHSPTLLKVSPSMGISWLVYEYSTALFFPQHNNGNGESTDDTKDE